MASFLHKAEDLATRWFGKSHDAASPVEDDQHAPEPSGNARMPVTAASPHAADTPDSMSHLYKGYAENGSGKKSKNGEIEAQLQGSLSGNSSEAAAFRKKLESSSIHLNVFSDPSKRGSSEIVDLDMHAVMQKAAREKISVFEAMKQQIEFNCYQSTGDWEQAYKLAAQVTQSLAMARSNAALLDRYQDEKQGLGVAMGHKDAAAAVKTKPPSEQADKKAPAQADSSSGEVLTSKDVVNTLVSGKSLKSEAAFRRAFLAVGSDPGGAKRFTKELVAGLDHKPGNRTSTLEILMGLRDQEAQGGSHELFDAYNQVIQAMAQAGTELPSEEDGYHLNHKGTREFSGTPVEVAREEKVHAKLIENANHESVAKEKKMAAEKDPGARGELHSANAKGPLFENGVSYKDVKQGGLGDCFFVASMSSVAHQQPDVIQKAITPEKTFPDGTPPPAGQQLYGVTFYAKGSDETLRPIKIYVTSNVAARKEGGFLGLMTHERAAFARAANSADVDKAESWPLIYEKAYAKFRGSYKDINDGGQGDEALETITGKHAREINPMRSTNEESFQFIQSAMQNKRPIVANTKHAYGKREDGRKELDLEDGLVSGHQYSVLGVRKEGGAIFVRVRNPWGTNGKSEGDGEQEIPIEQFKQNFTGLAAAG